MLIFMNGRALETIFVKTIPSIWLRRSWVVNRINVQNEAFFCYFLTFHMATPGGLERLIFLSSVQKYI